MKTNDVLIGTIVAFQVTLQSQTQRHISIGQYKPL